MASSKFALGCALGVTNRGFPFTPVSATLVLKCLALAASKDRREDRGETAEVFRGAIAGDLQLKVAVESFPKHDSSAECFGRRFIGHVAAGEPCGNARDSEPSQLSS